MARRDRRSKEAKKRRRAGSQRRRAQIRRIGRDLGLREVLGRPEFNSLTPEEKGQRAREVAKAYHHVRRQRDGATAQEQGAWVDDEQEGLLRRLDRAGVDLTQMGEVPGQAVLEELERYPWHTLSQTRRDEILDELRDRVLALARQARTRASSRGSEEAQRAD